MTTKYWEHDLGTANRPINTLYAKKIKVENETNAKNINFDKKITDTHKLTTANNIFTFVHNIPDRPLTEFPAFKNSVKVKGVKGALMNDTLL